MIATCLSLALLLMPIVVGPAAPTRSPIRQIDFRNFTYTWDDPVPLDTTWRWLDSSPESEIKVVDGTYRFDDEDDLGEGPVPFLSVVSVTYGDLTGDGTEQAAVELNYSTGGTNNWDYLYVYKLRKGRPLLLGRLQSGNRGYGGLIKVTVARGMLFTDFADKDQLRGECCSAGYIRVRYQWRQGRFVEFGTREYGDMELRKGPKGIYQWEEKEEQQKLR
jgi:hypothetical protein